MAKVRRYASRVRRHLDEKKVTIRPGVSSSEKVEIAEQVIKEKKMTRQH